MNGDVARENIGMYHAHRCPSRPSLPGDSDVSAVAPQPPFRFGGAHAANHEGGVGDLGGETTLRTTVHAAQSVVAQHPWNDLKKTNLNQSLC